jgi:hypothetical protein
VFLGVLARIIGVEGYVDYGDKPARVACTEDGREGGAVRIGGNGVDVDCEEDVGGIPGVGGSVFVCVVFDEGGEVSRDGKR